MKYTWNVMISWLLLQFLVPAAQSNFKEEILLSSSNNISCDRNTTIRIVDLKVQQYTTSCQEIKYCNLTDQQRSDIEISCNEKRSCTISTIIQNSCVVKDYGHVSVLYSCTGIVNSSCNFESGMCGWTIDGSDDYKWTLQSGKTPESNTGPDRDHTTASAYGHYMYTLSDSDADNNDTSDLFTGLIVSSPNQCLTFWYHMYGDDIKTLKLFQLSSVKIKLWSKSYNQGNKWYFQSLELHNIGSYRIQFKATRGNGDKSEIAVDDITITNTVCKKAVDCNFETGQCGWNTQETAYQWKNWYAKTPSQNTGPDFDHTHGTNTGGYMYLEASGISSGEKSNLTSETLYSDGDSCFTFWYHMYGNGMGKLNVYLDSEESSRIVWSKSGNRGDKWWFDSFNINTSKPYTIIFEGIRGSSKRSDIALDDILLISGSCQEGFPQQTETSESTPTQFSIQESSSSDPIYFAEPVSSPIPAQIAVSGCQTSDAFVLDCSFEVENCYWFNYPKTPNIWTITDGNFLQNGPGPYIDHTIGSNNGHYIYIDQMDQDFRKDVNSYLTSITIRPGTDICFTFWYHMYGENIGTLNVYTESGNTTEIQWSQSGNQGTSWQFAYLDISISEPYRIVFEGISGENDQSDISLDDILLLQRSCSDFAFDCSFEVGNCYWSTFPETSYVWKITETPITTGANGPYTDHTTGAAYGRYIFLVPTDLESQEGVRTNLTSLTISKGSEICFTFWYHMYGENIGTLNVYTESGNTTEIQWSQSGDQGNSWKFAYFDISIAEPYRIVFEGIRGDNNHSDISLDDILLLQRSCSDSINYSQSCYKPNESISLPECSKYYLQLNKTSLVFQPKFDDCSADYQHIQTSLINLCNKMNNSDICIFNLSDVSKTERKCFRSNRLLIEYTCDAQETTTDSSIVESTNSRCADEVTNTVPNVVVSTGSSRADEDTTTVPNVVVSTGSSSAVSEKGVSLPTVLKTSSESATGLIVGLVIGGLLLACLVIFIVIFVRRQTFGNGSNEKVRNNLHENDYIGCQDIALPKAADYSGLMKFADTQTLNDDEYAIINPSAETSFNEVISDGNLTADSYMILDPNDTGFNRTPFSNTSKGYEFAKPVRHTEKDNGDEDQYAVSDGVYDHSGNNRHKELEDNIYNHAVDTVYDSGSHMRNNDWREDTYDHFNGQLTEDDYDISTTT